MSEPIAYINGQWLPASKMALPINDAGFVLGATVVDYVRTFRHRLHRWPDHLARFQENIQEAMIWDWKYTDDELTAIAEEVVRRNLESLKPSQDLSLNVFATPGPVAHLRGPGAMSEVKPTLGMHAFPVPFERYRDLVRFGAWLRVSNLVEAPPISWIPPKIKHRSRLHWWMAEQDVFTMDLGESRALLLDEAGHVTETSFANVVAVRGTRVISPRRDTILPGISLQTLQELCPKVGLTFHERDLTLSECQNVDEMLVCGTAFGLASVRQLNDTTFPVQGPAFSALIEAWNEYVGLDIHEQILGSP